MLGAFLQYSQGGSDLVTEQSHLFRLLSSMQITDKGIWDTNLLAKQLLSLWNLASACHPINFNKALVGYKQLHHSVASNALGFSSHKERVHEEHQVDAPVSQSMVISAKVTRQS